LTSSALALLALEHAVENARVGCDLSSAFGGAINGRIADLLGSHG
jgi:hypothetical protein